VSGRLIYPNGLPDSTPVEAYLEEDGQASLEHAKNILDAVKRFIFM